MEVYSRECIIFLEFGLFRKSPPINYPIFIRDLSSNFRDKLLINLKLIIFYSKIIWNTQTYIFIPYTHFCKSNNNSATSASKIE